MGDTRRVLVIDDELGIRSVLAEALVEEGWEVQSARDGREALRVLRAWRPDAILLDLMMPVMDGWAFRKAQRGLPDGLSDVPLIVLSAAREVAAHGVALGAAVALPKPFDLDEVIEAIDRVLHR